MDLAITLFKLFEAGYTPEQIKEELDKLDDNTN